MRKIISTLILAGLISSAGFTQSKARFGLYIAPTLSSMKGQVKEIKNTGGRAGFMYTIMMDYNVSDNYSLSTELRIEHAGGNIDYKYDISEPIKFFPKSLSSDSFAGTTSIRYNNQYLVLPLGMKLKTNEIGYITYYAHVSFVPKLLIRSKGDIIKDKNSPVNLGDDKLEEVLYPDMRKMSLSWEIGAGIEYSLGGNTKAVAGVYYNNGFTDVTPKVDLAKIIANALQLRLGIKF